MKHNDCGENEANDCRFVKAPMKKLAPLIEETVNGGGTFRLITAGTSMLPLLRDRTDTVILKKAETPLKRYDIPLYRRANGQYVLHRILRLEKDGTYTLCGDNQTVAEKGIRDEDITAVASEIDRNGKTIRFSSFGYRLYVFLWCKCFLIRRILLKLAAAYLKIKNKCKGV